MCLICTCPPAYSTRPFGNSLTSDSIETSKLSELGRGPKWTISCYDGVETGM
ncbi:unnamed protein product [Malus baccata var. baccata]